LSLTNFGAAYEGKNPCLCAPGSYSGYHSFAEAQQSTKIPRIGYLAAGSPPPDIAFLQGLRELGYVEGKNITTQTTAR
jgi:hypothetical protein